MSNGNKHSSLMSELVLGKIERCGQALFKNNNPRGIFDYTNGIDDMLNFLEDLRISEYRKDAKKIMDGLTKFKTRKYFNLEQTERVDQLIAEIKSLKGA